ncbi:hypothetical protein ACOMHN_047287 [Nucella lapillus]
MARSLSRRQLLTYCMTRARHKRDDISEEEEEDEREEGRRDGGRKEGGREILRFSPTSRVCRVLEVLLFGDGRTLKMVTANDHNQHHPHHHHPNHNHHQHQHPHQQQQQASPSSDKARSHSQQAESLEVTPFMTGSPSAPAFLTKEGQISSPVLFKDNRLLRKKGSTNDLEIAKAERRKSDKEKRVIYDSNALFEAVEQQDLDAVKAILDSKSVDINSLNAENLSALDIALMTNNIPMAKMLLMQGARESPMFQESGSGREDQLDVLVSEAEQRVVDLTALVLNGTSGNVSMSPTQLRDHERHLNHWEFRHRLLKRMKAGYDHARPPDPPTHVSLTVASNCSLHVSFGEPLNHNGAVVTKYRVEWSSHENFVLLTGDAIVEDLRHLEREMKGLTKGCRYYVRVSACNVKGYGGHTLSSPAYAVPSSWREVEGTVSRLEGKVQSLQVLFDQVRRSRPPEAAEVKDTSSADSPQQKKRISIKSLFSAPKFQKTVKRGVHLATLLVCEGRVLVTSDEQIPIVEVDENFSGTSIQSELYWLMKIACTWEDVKLLRQDMEKTKSAGSTFRTKLLQAIASLQNFLGLQDLGKFFHRPLRAANGSLLLTLVNQVRDTKFVAVGSSRWVSLGKLGRRQSLPSMDIGEAHNLLMASIPDMLMYREVCEMPLAKGLYLGFLKIQVSMESVRILVPLRAPNMLPYAKIRDCPNVSKEEWEWLQSMDSRSPATQPQFFSVIHKAATKLFSQLGISMDQASGYRLYDVEVIEVSPSVSFLLLLLLFFLLLILTIYVLSSSGISMDQESGYRLYDVEVIEVSPSVSFLLLLLLLLFFLLLILTIYVLSSSGISMDQESGYRLYDVEVIEVSPSVSFLLLLLLLLFFLLLILTIYVLSSSGISMDQASGYRLYDVEVIEVSPNVSFLVLLPPVEQVCMAPGQSDHLADRKDCVLLPVQVFETIHMSTYQPQMFASYARLSSITDMDMVLAGQAQREAFSSEELSAAKDQLEISSHLQQNLDKMWKSTRWVMDLITFARRDKLLRPSVSTAPLFFPQGNNNPPPPPHPSHPPPRAHTPSSPGSDFENGVRDGFQNVDNTSNEISVGRDHRRIARFFDPNDEEEEDEKSEDGHNNRHKGSATSITDTDYAESEMPPSSPSSPMTSGILRVYADYDTGLAKGVSVKLHVTAHTTARDVINLVVRHLHEAGDKAERVPSSYADDPHLDSYCLVASLGSKERVLGDDYPPLRLQPPWLKGRLYVRAVPNVVDLLQQGEATAV